MEMSGNIWGTGPSTQIVEALQNISRNVAQIQQVLVKFFNSPVAITTPTMPPSGTQVLNSTGVPVTVYVSGGTVSQISVNGVVTGLISGAFPLKPNEGITITYSAAPTWAWVG
jgi:enamine deaminase RidA (YjgF/YER057c/UK114 family)